MDWAAFRAKVADEWGEEAVDMIDGAEMPRFSKEEKEVLKRTKKEWKDVCKVYGARVGEGSSKLRSPYCPLPMNPPHGKTEDSFFRQSPTASGGTGTRSTGSSGGFRAAPPRMRDGITCFLCRSPGHLKVDCPRLKQESSLRAPKEGLQ
eukprot:TRINITY_DN16552_c0_g1_i1.p3 TRINITY_DN16552_c0_g1~~TRINITY_DN16552_c0_g1_i1.p3  ORF type:complete len:149 (-),score=3.55 TRINITY_DN16552_c0_g1_i1:787-1233(-)